MSVITWERRPYLYSLIAVSSDMAVGSPGIQVDVLLDGRNEARL